MMRDDPRTDAMTSHRMRQVGQKDTAAEMRLRRGLWRAGLRYRLGMRVAGARPDLVFPRRKLSIFVDGCFWHGCPRHYVAPERNSSFWQGKLECNRTRDVRDKQRLEDAGWDVLRIWECEVDRELDRVVQEVSAAVRNSTAYTGCSPSSNVNGTGRT